MLRVEKPDSGRRAEGIALGILKLLPFKSSQKLQVDKAEKKTTGSFDTPSYLAGFLLRRALEKKLEDLFQLLDSHIHGDRFSEAREIFIESMSIRILDPAMGKGIFLLEGLHLLRNFYQRITRRVILAGGPLAQLLSKELEQLERPAAFALRENLYGVDLSHSALEMASLSLLAASDDPEQRKLHNLKRGNSLVSSIMPEQRSAMDPWKVSKLISLRRKTREEQPWQRHWLKEERIYYRNSLNLEFHNDISKHFNSSGAGEQSEAFNWEVEFPEVFFNPDGSPKENPGFDLVVGNPPWGADVDHLKGYVEEFYPDFCKGYKDSYKLFLGKIVSLVRDGGIVAQALPNTFQFMPCYQDLREMLLCKRILYLANLGEGVFPEVSTPCSVLVFENSPWKRNQLLAADISQIKGPVEKRIHLETGRGNRWLEQSLYKSTGGNNFLFFVRSSKSHEIPLQEVAIVKDPGVQYHRRGCGRAARGKGTLSSRILYEGKREDPLDIKVIRGSDLDRWNIDYSIERYLRHEYRELLDATAGETVTFNRPFFEAPEKILWRQTSDRPKASIERKRTWFMNTLQGAILREEWKSKISCEYLLGLLNSSLLAYYYMRLSEEKGRTFPQVRISNIKNLPVKIAGRDEARGIERKVRALLEIGEKAAAAGKDFYTARKELEESLDALVMDLYEIPKIERQEILDYLA